MPQHPRRKRSSNAPKTERQSAPEHYSQSPEDELLTDSEQRTHNCIPFYDDPNHVAYGWQQMGPLPECPGFHTLVPGTQDDPPLISAGWPRIRPAEQYQRDGRRGEQSGFNLHPRRGDGPRRPPPMSGGEGSRAHRSRFEPFVDPTSDEPEDYGVEYTDTEGNPVRTALTSKDVNQKLRTSQQQRSEPSTLNLTENLRIMQLALRSNKRIPNELQGPSYESREIDRMSSLVEEPAPLRIRKKHDHVKSRENRRSSGTLEQARKLRAEQQKLSTAPLINNSRFPGATSSKPTTKSAAYAESSRRGEGLKVWVHEASEDEDEDIKAKTHTSAPANTTQSPLYDLNHRSAIPAPLNLHAIRAAKAENQHNTTPTYTTTNPAPVSDNHDRADSHATDSDSVESYITSSSSGFEEVWMPWGREAEGERNGRERKWYKGFRRSG